MKKHLLLGLAILILPVCASVAQTTTGVLRGGIAINEVLADPNSTSNNFDTDGNGTAATEDEFVELYNTTGTPIDISGLQLWDAGGDNYCTVPAGQSLNGNEFALLLISVQAGGSLPAVTGLAFDCAAGGTINNGGDNVVVYDPTADEYIQILYNGDAPDTPPGDPTNYSGFSATATRVGAIEDWGSDTDGFSIAREPDGDLAVGIHLPPNASPGNTNDTTLPIELISFDAISGDNSVTLRWTASAVEGQAVFEVQHWIAGEFTTVQTVPGSANKNEYTATIESKPGLNKFRLRMVESDGFAAYSGIVESVVELPSTLFVSDAYPNPFASTARFEVASATEARITAKLFNALGQEVLVLFDGVVSANIAETVTVDAGSLPNGIYLYRINSGDRVTTRKLMLVR